MAYVLVYSCESNRERVEEVNRHERNGKTGETEFCSKTPYFCIVLLY